MDEFRVKITVRNNLLLTAIEKAGFKSQAEFARYLGVEDTNVSEIVSMRKSPLNNRTGEFSEIAKLIMEGLGACPSDLWTDEQLTMKLERNTSERAMSLNNMIAVMGNPNKEIIGFNPQSLDSFLDKKDLAKLVEDRMDTLTPRESKVLKLRYGIGCDEHNLDQVASMFTCSRERIRQIEAKALRKLRRPERAELVRSYWEEE